MIKKTPKKKTPAKPPICPNRIFLSKNPEKVSVIIDGKKLENIQSITIEQTAKDGPQIHLILSPEVISIEVEKAEIIIDQKTKKIIKSEKSKVSYKKGKRRKPQTELEKTGQELLDKFHSGDLDIDQYEVALEDLYNDNEYDEDDENEFDKDESNKYFDDIPF